MSHQRRAISSQGSRNLGLIKQVAPQYKQQMKLPRLLSSAEGQSSIEQYGLDMGASSQQGRRPYQEDEFTIKPFLKTKGSSNDSVETHFFGLFDGHAGGRCSKFVSTTFTDNLVEDPAYGHNLPQAVKRCFYNTNEQFLQIAERMKLHDGSTGICGIVRDGKVLVSNVGDCRCIILSNGKPIQMSVDQKPTSPDEQRRIASFGGTVVYCMGTARVNGVLAVSRAFGNRTLRSVIRPDPELSMREFTKDDDYLIMASDGLWDVLRNVDVSHIAYNCVHTNGHSSTSTGSICQIITEELVNAALSRGSMDNVTCICIKISGLNGLYSLHHGGGNNTSNNVNNNNNRIPSSGASSRAASAANAYRNNFNNNEQNTNNASNSGNNNNPTAAVTDMLSVIMSSTSGGTRNKANNKKPLYNNTNANQNQHRAMTPSNMESHSKEQESYTKESYSKESQSQSNHYGGNRPKLNKSQSLRRINEPYGASGNANALSSMSIVDDSDNGTITGSSSNSISKHNEEKQSSSSLSRFMNASFRLRSNEGNTGQTQGHNNNGYGSFMNEGSDGQSTMMNSKNSIAGHNGDINNSYVISANTNTTTNTQMLSSPIVSGMTSGSKRPQSVGGNIMHHQHGGGTGRGNSNNNTNNSNNSNSSNNNMPVIYGHNQHNHNRTGNSGLFNSNNNNSSNNNYSSNNYLNRGNNGIPHPNHGYH